MKNKKDMEWNISQIEYDIEKWEGKEPETSRLKQQLRYWRNKLEEVQ